VWLIRSKTVQNQKAFEPYQDLARYNDLRSVGAMEEYNRTRCTRVVDRSKTVQNQKAFEPYQDLVRYNDLRSARAMEEYNQTRCTRVVDPFQSSFSALQRPS
jgi:muramidase (phage lysozyme)